MLKIEMPVVEIDQKANLRALISPPPCNIYSCYDVFSFWLSTFELSLIKISISHLIVRAGAKENIIIIIIRYNKDINFFFVRGEKKSCQILIQKENDRYNDYIHQIN